MAGKLATTPTERADARANRLRVLEAARRVFAERGLAAEIKDIAGVAGVGVGTIYRGFGSKTDLLSAVADQAAQRLETLFRDAEGEEDPAKALRRLLEAGVRHIDSYGWLFQLFFSGQAPIPARPQPHTHADFDRRLRSLIERGVTGRAFRPDLDVEVAAMLIQGALLAVISPAGKEPRGRPGPERLAEGVVRLLSQPQTAP